MKKSTGKRHGATPIRSYLISGVCAAWMAREMGVSVRTIFRVKSGTITTVNARTWKAFVRLLKSGKRMKTTSDANGDNGRLSSIRMQGNKIASTKLDPDKVRAIRMTYKRWAGQNGISASASQEQLAVAYGVSKYTIIAVVYGSIWKDA